MNEGGVETKDLKDIYPYFLHDLIYDVPEEKFEETIENFKAKIQSEELLNSFNIMPFEDRLSISLLDTLSAEELEGLKDKYKIKGYAGGHDLNTMLQTLENIRALYK